MDFSIEPEPRRAVLRLDVPQNEPRVVGKNLARHGLQTKGQERMVDLALSQIGQHLVNEWLVV